MILKSLGIFTLILALTASIFYIFISNFSDENLVSKPNLIGEIKNFKISKEKKIFQLGEWQDLSGKKNTIKNYNGKIVLMNFWATWCLPCIEELPSLNNLQAKLDSNKFESPNS